MNVYHLVLRGGRWSVIMLSMIQAEQTSHLSPYCNESMFRNSNYLFHRLTNDKNSSVMVCAHHSNTNMPTCTHCSWCSRWSCWPLTPAVTSLLILFLDQTSLCVEQSAKACACSPTLPISHWYHLQCDYKTYWWYLLYTVKISYYHFPLQSLQHFVKNMPIKQEYFHQFSMKITFRKFRKMSLWMSLSWNYLVLSCFVLHTSGTDRCFHKENKIFKNEKRIVKMIFVLYFYI